MKKDINILINKVLGQFWTKWFKDSEIISYIREITGSTYNWIDQYIHDLINSKIMKRDIDGVLQIDYTSIPAGECNYNENVKEVATFDNLPISHQGSCRYINIPEKYIQGNIIVDDLYNTKSVWIIGINASRDDEYVRLYLNDGYDLPSTIRGSQTVPAIYYHLYVYIKQCPIDHSADFGTILGHSISKLSPFLRQICWKMYVKGVSILNIKQVVAGCTDNEVCREDDYFLSSWQEGNRYYVETLKSVYSGTGVPMSFTSSTRLSPGTQLFDDSKVTYSNHVADVFELPLIGVKSGDEMVYLQNSTQDTIIINGGCTLPVLCSENYYTNLSNFLIENSLEAPFDLSVTYVNPVYTYMAEVRKDTLTIGLLKNPDKVDSDIADTLLDICVYSMYKGMELNVLEYLEECKTVVSPTGYCTVGYANSIPTLVVPQPSSIIKTMYL